VGPLFSLDECVDGHTLAPKQTQAAFDSCLGKDQKGENEELVVRLTIGREKLLPLLDRGLSRASTQWLSDTASRVRREE
jgi:hypothetical protein